MKHIDSILLVSTLCSRSVQEKIFEYDPSSLGLQIQKYLSLLVKGFKSNNLSVTALTYSLSMKKTIGEQPINECEDNIIYSYVIPHFRSPFHYLEVFGKSFQQTRKYLKKNPSGAVVCDALNIFNSLGAVAACKLMRRKVTGIITDFPELSNEHISLINRFNWWIIHRYNAYVLLSAAMAEKLHMKNKASIVLEGHVDSEIRPTIPYIKRDLKQPRICLYAGAVDKRNGLGTLVKAFQQVNLPNTQLHIYGDGNDSQFLQELNDPAIVYWGKVPNKQVVEAEHRATLLINPRPTTASFVKYSFPSKNLEYMASGTPCLFTKLPCIPTEYDPYIFYFRDETVEGMAEDLRSVLTLSDEELHERGAAAQRFVLEKKNNVVQAGKIIKMLENLVPNK